MSASALPVCSDVDVQVVMWCRCGQSFRTSLPYKDISAENIHDLNLRVWAHVQGAPRGKWGPYHMSWEDVTKARVTIHNDEMTEDYKMPKLSGSHPLLCGVVPLVQCMRLKKKRIKINTACAWLSCAWLSCARTNLKRTNLRMVILRMEILVILRGRQLLMQKRRVVLPEEEWGCKGPTRPPNHRPKNRD